MVRARGGENLAIEAEGHARHRILMTPEKMVSWGWAMSTFSKTYLGSRTGTIPMGTDGNEQRQPLGSLDLVIGLRGQLPRQRQPPLALSILSILFGESCLLVCC